MWKVSEREERKRNRRGKKKRGRRRRKKGRKKRKGTAQVSRKQDFSVTAQKTPQQIPK